MTHLHAIEANAIAYYWELARCLGGQFNAQEAIIWFTTGRRSLPRFNGVLRTVVARPEHVGRVVQPAACRARQILDIACGCAIKSFALAQVSPSVQIICLDSPAVLEVARDLARRMGIVARVVWRPANLLTADLGVSKFDAALVGQITHYLTPEQNRDLFRRIHAALKPGGTLVLGCPMAGAAPEETTCFLTLFLWANGGGGAHAFAMYRAWLSDSGFQAVTPLSDRSLAAQK